MLLLLRWGAALGSGSRCSCRDQPICSCETGMGCRTGSSSQDTEELMTEFAAPLLSHFYWKRTFVSLSGIVELFQCVMRVNCLSEACLHTFPPSWFFRVARTCTRKMEKRSLQYFWSIIRAIPLDVAFYYILNKCTGAYLCVLCWQLWLMSRILMLLQHFLFATVQFEPLKEWMMDTTDQWNTRGWFLWKTGFYAAGGIGEVSSPFI